MQVYAVVYTSSGRFLLFWKLAKGYFFFDAKTGKGKIVKGGANLNGGNDYALPGGRREESETVAAGAAREFLEETAADVRGLPVQEKTFGRDFCAGYFRIEEKEIEGLLARIQDPNLVSAMNASIDIEHGSITRYAQIHTRYPSAPRDNELETGYLWSVHDEANWEVVLSWKNSPALGWYFDILDYLKTSIL
ncbi:NUDIX hydrolase [Pseudomonas aeruginosa]|uniref:NUDIX hydrolase n=1 Tax=Pseudomonas aeruginosa group TaxID=136841 RepID=UPI00071B8E41|nr:NUDIX domain-containing protein [Pseudomonas aeruginosa]KSR37758.1 hypothetical protein APB45_28440 [Pseudomonas aeruginosa]RPV10042.1 NUDIX hydrolase [Pseudomonas aeruginosa]